MDIEGTVGWSDWIRLALLVATWCLAFWVGREWERRRDEW